jgi:hypothetical protein
MRLKINRFFTPEGFARLLRLMVIEGLWVVNKNCDTRIVALWHWVSLPA